MMKTLTEILRSLEGLSDIELFVIDLFCGAGGLSEGVEAAQAKKNTEPLCGKLREMRLKKIKNVA